MLFLAHPEGYDIIPEVEDIVPGKTGCFRREASMKANSMEEGFKDADIVLEIRRAERRLPLCGRTY